MLKATLLQHVTFVIRSVMSVKKSKDPISYKYYVSTRLGKGRRHSAMLFKLPLEVKTFGKFRTVIDGFQKRLLRWLSFAALAAHTNGRRYSRTF